MTIQLLVNCEKLSHLFKVKKGTLYNEGSESDTQRSPVGVCSKKELLQIVPEKLLE